MFLTQEKKWEKCQDFGADYLYRVPRMLFSHVSVCVYVCVYVGKLYLKLFQRLKKYVKYKPQLIYDPFCETAYKALVYRILWLPKYTNESLLPPLTHPVQPLKQYVACCCFNNAS